MFRFLTVCALAGAATSGLAADKKAISEGGKLYKAKQCHTCHGEEGKKPIAPNYPKLAGQNEQYLLDQTKHIRDGVRKSGLSMVMTATLKANTISDAEAKAISAYLASQKP